MEETIKILDADGNELVIGDTVLIACTVSQLLPLEGVGGFNLRVLAKGPDDAQLQIALSAGHVRKVVQPAV